MRKSKGKAYLLLMLLGFFGGHCFYLEKIGKGILYCLTGGLLGFGVIIDLFTLGKQVDNYNTASTPSVPFIINIKNNLTSATN